MRGRRDGQRHDHRAPGLAATFFAFKVAIAVAAFVVIFRVGFVVLRGLSHPVPEPPPPGEMRRVNLRFRCAVCGVELRLTMANEEEPPPPKHCLEDMDLVAPID